MSDPRAAAAVVMGRRAHARALPPAVEGERVNTFGSFPEPPRERKTLSRPGVEHRDVSRRAAGDALGQLSRLGGIGRPAEMLGDPASGG